MGRRAKQGEPPAAPARLTGTLRAVACADGLVIVFQLPDGAKARTGAQIRAAGAPLAWLRRGRWAWWSTGVRVEHDVHTKAFARLQLVRVDWTVGERPRSPGAARRELAERQAELFPPPAPAPAT
jgi:hypothetical protein